MVGYVQEIEEVETQPGEDPAVWWVAQARRDGSGALVGARHLVGHLDVSAIRDGEG